MKEEKKHFLKYVFKAMDEEAKSTIGQATIHWMCCLLLATNLYGD